LQAPADADSFYHVRHAWLYRRGGVFQTAFPWAQYSVIKTYAADLWYGFHVLLLPLTSFDDLVKGISIGAYVTMVLTLGLVYLALRRLELGWPVCGSARRCRLVSSCIPSPGTTSPTSSSPSRRSRSWRWDISSG